MWRYSHKLLPVLSPHLFLVGSLPGSREQYPWCGWLQTGWEEGDT